MRRWGFLGRRALAAGLAAGALAGAEAAAAAGPYGPKVDGSVVAMARAAASDASQLRVIVWGRDVDAGRARAGASLRHRLSVTGGESMRVRVRDLLKLAASGGVTRITADVPVAPTAAPPILFPTLSTLYPLVTGAKAAWDQGLSGAGVGIAVIDSGVTATADFGARVVPVQYDPAIPTADTNGHGTFVAAVAAGSSPDGRHVGVAPGATVYSLNVARPDGTYTSDVVKAVDWVLANHAQHNIRVVNLSLSETAPSSYLQSILDTAVERLWKAGVVVVASAGNRGANSTSYAPANDPFVITVGALDTGDTLAEGDDVVASFSSRGTTQDGFAKPELVAPGRRIASALPTGTALAGQAPLTSVVSSGYALMSGTSFAAPQVAGAAAILLQKNPGWTPDNVKWLLNQTSRSVSGSGARRIDLAQALAFTGTPQSANQGVTQSTYGLDTSGTASTNGAAWNGVSWNGASWNGAAWNGVGWNGVAWNTFAWN